MVTWLVGDLLTGRRIQTLIPLSGTWSEVLNDAGDVSCVVSLHDRANRRLGLQVSAAPGQAFLAAIEGDTVLQAGPIWLHDYDKDSEQLTLTARGMWSYFDHRTLLPVLAGRNPDDPTTDTRFSPVSVDPDDPWPIDTRTSLQGIARALVEQAQSWTGGDVPVILPTEIAGTAERWYKGADLGMVGERLAQLTQVDGGPDIMFTPRLQADRMGVEWVMRIGTPTNPLLASPLPQVFNIGIASSSVSNVKVRVDGSVLASQTFASGGRTSDQSLIAVTEDSTLTDAGYPLLEVVDGSHSTVSNPATLQGYSDERAGQGRKPVTVWSFSHDLSRQPFVESFNAGDFCTIRVMDDAYIETRDHQMRCISRAGDAEGRKISLRFLPEVA